jgi:hypothetical protein
LESILKFLLVAILILNTSNVFSQAMSKLTDYTKLSEQELQDRLECSPETIQKYLIAKGVMSENLCIKSTNDSFDIHFKGTLFRLAKHMGEIKPNSMTGNLTGGETGLYTPGTDPERDKFLNLPEPQLLANYLHNLNIIAEITNKEKNPGGTGSSSLFSINAFGYADGVQFNSKEFDDAIVGNPSYLVNNWSEIVDTNIVRRVKPTDITLTFLKDANKIAFPEEGSLQAEKQIAATQIRNHFLAYARAENVSNAFINIAKQNGANIPGITNGTINGKIHAHNSKLMDRHFCGGAGYCSSRRGGLFKIEGQAIKKIGMKPNIVVDEATEVHPLFTTPSTKLMRIMNTHAVITMLKDVQDYINNEGEGKIKNSEIQGNYAKFMKETLTFLFPYKGVEEDESTSAADMEADVIKEKVFDVNKMSDAEMKENEFNDIVNNASKYYEIIDKESVQVLIRRGLDSSDQILTHALNVIYADSTELALKYLKDNANKDVLCNVKKKPLNINMHYQERFKSLNTLTERNVKCYMSFYKRFLQHYIEKINVVKSDAAYVTLDKFFIQYIKNKYSLTEKAAIKYNPLIYWVKAIFLNNIKAVKSVGKKIVILPKSKINSSPKTISDIENKAPNPHKLSLYIPSYEAFNQLTKLMFYTYTGIVRSLNMYGPIVNRDQFKENTIFSAFPFKDQENSFLKEEDKDKEIVWILNEYSDAYATKIAKEYYKRIINNKKALTRMTTNHNLRYRINQMAYTPRFFTDASLYLPVLEKTAKHNKDQGDVGWSGQIASHIPELGFFDDDVTTPDTSSKYSIGLNFKSPKLSNFIYSNQVFFHRNNGGGLYILKASEPLEKGFDPKSDNYIRARELMHREYFPRHATRKLIRIFWNAYLFPTISHTYASSMSASYDYLLPSSAFTDEKTYAKHYYANFPVLTENAFFEENEVKFVERKTIPNNPKFDLEFQTPPNVPTTTVMSFFDYAESYAEFLNIYSNGVHTDLSYAHRGASNTLASERKLSYSFGNADRALVSKMLRTVGSKAKRVFYSPSLISSYVTQGTTKINGFYHKICKTGVFIENDDHSSATEFYYQSRYRKVKTTYTKKNPAKDEKIYFESYDIPNSKHGHSTLADNFPSFNLIQLKRPTAYLIKNNCSECSCLKTGNLTGQGLRNILASAQRMDFSKDYKRYLEKGDNTPVTKGPYAEKEFPISGGNYCLFSPIVPQSHDVGEGSSEDTNDHDHKETENEYLAGVFACPMIDALYLNPGVSGVKTFKDVNLDEGKKNKIEKSCDKKGLFPLAEDKYLAHCSGPQNDVCDLYTDEELSSLGVSRSECTRPSGLSGDAAIKWKLPKNLYKHIYGRDPVCQ